MNKKVIMKIKYTKTYANLNVFIKINILYCYDVYCHFMRLYRLAVRVYIESIHMLHHFYYKKICPS